MIALLVGLEALYIFISLKALMSKKISALRNGALFLGIITANQASGILYATPFRFLLVTALIYGLLWLICKRVYFYAFYLIMAVYALKMTVEIGAMLIIGVDNFNMITALIGSISFLVVPLALFIPTRRLVAKIQTIWERENTFYVRYTLSLAMMAGVFLYLHIIMQHVTSIL